MSTLLGRKAKDTITGFTGVITATAEFLHGRKRLGLSPTRLDGGKMIDPVWMDEAQLKIGKVHTKVLEVPLTVALGEVVKDSITGFKGKATGRYVYLNGCIRIEVTPMKLKDGKLMDTVTFDEQQLVRNKNAKPFFNPEHVKSELMKLPGGPRSGPTPYPTCERY